MGYLIGTGIAIGVLYLWLRGHWFGWVLIFFPATWIVQLVLHQGQTADPPELIAMRAAGVLILTGIPCMAWGSMRRSATNGWLNRPSGYAIQRRSFAETYPKPIRIILYAIGIGMIVTLIPVVYFNMTQRP